MAVTAKRIRELRKKASLTQEQFGQIFGVVKATVSSYETGNSTPDDETKIRICRYFGVSSDYLIGLTDYPAKHPVTENDVKVALFGQDTNVTDEMWDDLLKYAHFLAHHHSKERYMEFAARLRFAMKKRNVTAEALVNKFNELNASDEKIELTRGKLAQYLDARAVPDDKNNHIALLAQALSLPTTYFDPRCDQMSEQDLEIAFFGDEDPVLENDSDTWNVRSTQALKIAARGGGVKEITVTDSQLQEIVNLPEVKDLEDDKS